jgi:hypothetical protein
MRPPHMRTALLAALFIVAGIGLTPGPSTAADDDAYRTGYANRMIRQEEPMTVGDPDGPGGGPAPSRAVLDHRTMLLSFRLLLLRSCPVGLFTPTAFPADRTAIKQSIPDDRNR